MPALVMTPVSWTDTTLTDHKAASEDNTKHPPDIRDRCNGAESDWILHNTSPASYPGAAHGGASPLESSYLCMSGRR